MTCACCSPLTPTPPSGALPRGTAGNSFGAGPAAPNTSADGSTVPIFGFTSPGGKAVLVTMQARVELGAVAGFYDYAVALQYSDDGGGTWNTAGSASLVSEVVTATTPTQLEVTVIGAVPATTTIALRVQVGNNLASVGDVTVVEAPFIAWEVDLV